MELIVLNKIVAIFLFYIKIECVKDLIDISNWKMTSIFVKVEDNLNFLSNGRGPQIISYTYIILNWKKLLAIRLFFSKLSIFFL